MVVRGQNRSVRHSGTGGLSPEEVDFVIPALYQLHSTAGAPLAGALTRGRGKTARTTIAPEAATLCNIYTLLVSVCTQAEERRACSRKPMQKVQPEPTQDQIDAFQAAVWAYYAQHGRSFPWRSDARPYRVLVSEVMLQQTQTGRVVPKFQEFMEEFPNIETLADASLAQVIHLWQGLGYNRRAKYLHETAGYICREHGGAVPSRVDELKSLPGIGPNTAGSIAAFAYNLPVVFIETNIRSLFLYWFFDGQGDVSDQCVLPLIEHTLSQQHPRHWYWAVMDYGVHIKHTIPNPSRRSRHYSRQTPFAFSRRKVRGEVIRLLTKGPHAHSQLAEYIGDERLEEVLEALEAEHLITWGNDAVYLRE